MHPVTHFVSAIAVANVSNDIHTLLRLFSWDGMIYVCYVSIPPRPPGWLVIKIQGLMLLSDGSLRDWFRRLPVYRGIL